MGIDGLPGWHPGTGPAPPAVVHAAGLRLGWSLPAQRAAGLVEAVSGPRGTRIPKSYRQVAPGSSQ